MDGVSDAPACPTERPVAGAPCSTQGWVCSKTCTPSDRRAWTAECRLSLGRLYWSAWGNPCSDSEY